MAREQRRLAAILVLDVVGSSRLMGRDESGTVARLRDHRIRRLEPALLRHGGRLVKLTGDGALAEFTSAVAALSAAIEFQQAMADANCDEPESTAIVFRIGLHLGDVIVEDGDLLGDEVNVAKRLEEQAPGGSVVVSRTVREAVGGRLKVSFADLGSPLLKNIERPVQAYQVGWQAADWTVSLLPAGAFSMKTLRGRRRIGLSVAALVGVIVLAGLAYVALAPTPPPTIAQLRDLKAADLERLLAERRAADAAAAEKRRLEEEARRKVEAEATALQQADADLTKARQDRQKAEGDLASFKAEIESRRLAAADQRQLANSAAQRLLEERAQLEAETEMAALRAAEQEAARRATAEAENKRLAEQELALAQAARQAAEIEAWRQEQAEAAVGTTRKLRADAEAGEATLRLTQADRQIIQIALTALGFDTRGSDGILGARSREMLANWQHKVGAPATGFVTAEQRDDLLRSAAPAIARFDGERKKAEEQKKRDDENRKANAARLAVEASAPAPRPGAHDGTYSATRSTPSGRLTVTLAVTASRGSLTVGKAGCSSKPIAVTVSFTGEISGRGELDCPIPASSSQDISQDIVGAATITGRALGGKVEVTLSTTRGNFSTSLDRSPIQP